MSDEERVLKALSFALRYGRGANTIENTIEKAEEMGDPTDYERLTYEGRKICDREELQGGYCGSCSLSIHIIQMRDPLSWVHASVPSWERAARKDLDRQNAVRASNEDYNLLVELCHDLINKALRFEKQFIDAAEIYRDQEAALRRLIKKEWP